MVPVRTWSQKPVHNLCTSTRVSRRETCGPRGCPSAILFKQLITRFELNFWRVARGCDSLKNERFCQCTKTKRWVRFKYYSVRKQICVIKKTYGCRHQKTYGQELWNKIKEVQTRWGGMTSRSMRMGFVIPRSYSGEAGGYRDSARLLGESCCTKKWGATCEKIERKSRIAG